MGGCRKIAAIQRLEGARKVSARLIAAPHDLSSYLILIKIKKILNKHIKTMAY